MIPSRKVTIWVSGAAALLLLLAGGVSVFTERNGVGSAALIAAGLFAGVLALGYRLKTLRLPDGTQFDVEEATDLLESGNEEAAANVVVGALKRAEDSARPFGQSVRDYEVTVRDLIRSALPEIRISQPIDPDGGIFDFILYGQRQGGLNVGVEVRGGTKVDAERLTANFGMALRSDVLEVDALIVIIRSDPESPEVETIQRILRQRMNVLFGIDELRVRVLGWTVSDPPTSLTDPIVAMVRDADG